MIENSISSNQVVNDKVCFVILPMYICIYALLCFVKTRRNEIYQSFRFIVSFYFFLIE